MQAAGLAHVELREGDFREMPFDTPFAAVVGRAVLMYAADPAAAIRALLTHVRPGGIDTLADRLRAETVAGGGVLPLQMIVGAAARTP